MKKNNWLYNKINQKPDYILLIGILICCFIYRLFYFKFFIHNISYNSDTVTYFAPINIFNGNIDLYRTPVYIYIIKLFEYLSREHFIQNLILFQHSISFLSIIPFYFISKSVIKIKYMVIITTLIYGCFPLLINQNVNINPECLTIVGSTLFLFLFVRYIDKPTKYNAIFIGFFTFVLIMLKPTYLILLCLVFVFLIFRFILYRQEKILIYWGLVAWFFAVIGVMSYCEMNKKYNGEFVLSKILLNNNLANIIISGAYKLGEDKEFISIIDTTKQKWFYIPVFVLNNECIDNYKKCLNKFPQYLSPTSDMIFCLSIPNTENYSIERISKFVMKSQNSMTYIKYNLKQIIKIFFYNKFLLLILILQSIAIVYVFFKQKKVAWKHTLCILFILGQFITIAIGAMGDWDRLLMPSYPFIILIIGSFTEILISSFNLKKLIILINNTFE